MYDRLLVAVDHSEVSPRVIAAAKDLALLSKGKVWVWYSEDATHTPVQIRAKLSWGTLLFRLQRIEK